MSTELWPITVLAARVDDIGQRLRAGAPRNVLSGELGELHEQLLRHALPHRTPKDHDMIGVAKNRGDVVLDDGTVVTLVAWRYTGNRNRARIMYPSGRPGSVSCSAVLGPPIAVAQ